MVAQVGSYYSNTTHAIILLTAMDGSDYIYISSNEFFTSGFTNGTTRCEDIIILDDNALEGNQTITVTLTTSDPDVVIGNHVITITITDNDG